MKAGRNSSRSRGPSRPSRFTRGRLLVPALGTVFFSLVYLSGMNSTLAMAGRLEGLRTQEEALQRRVDRLSLTLAEDRRSDRIVAGARRLGLEFPATPVEVLAVAPAATGRGPSLWTYVENAVVMALEGMARGLTPSARANQAAAADSGRGP